ncbi:MAG: hypothetical protein O2955_15420 [Planctomycetota bacterium]|nr:hypothetical protein [Planctomycetota bacterium]MDA1213904.1 hypothetical protein [Planctomycetota bacterium]
MPSKLPALATGLLFVSLMIILVLRAPTHQATGENEKPTPHPDNAERSETATEEPPSTIPEELQVLVTVEFKETPLTEIVDWIREHAKIDILIDEENFGNEGIDIDSNITVHLDNEPLYLLLDRLKPYAGWYIEDEIIFVTTEFHADEVLNLELYPVGDLFDVGYNPHGLFEVIKNETSGLWQDSGDGEGSIDFDAEMLFIRQTQRVQREIYELLAALRHPPSEVIFFNDPMLNPVVGKVNQRISIDFHDTPLNKAIEHIQQQVGVTFTINEVYLHEEGLKQNEIVTLKLTDKPLNVILDRLLSGLAMSWVPQEGGIVITTYTQACDTLTSAIYNVGDLVNNERDARGLSRIVRDCTSGLWEPGDGDGIMYLPRPNLMIVRQTFHVHLEIMELLNRYRTTIVRRPDHRIDDVSRRDVYTHFYKMPTSLARDLVKTLPQLVAPETWKENMRPDAIGTIHFVVSDPVVVDPTGKPPTPFSDSKKDEKETKAAEKHHVVPHSVLIIHQERDVHEEIDEFIRRTKTGDAHPHTRAHWMFDPKLPYTYSSGFGFF